MARRRPQDEPPVDVERFAERRYMWLARWLLIAEPDKPEAELGARIRDKRDRLDRRGGPICERLAALEAFLAELGELQAASAFADRRLSARTPRGARGRRGA